MEIEPLGDSAIPPADPPWSASSQLENAEDNGRASIDSSTGEYYTVEMDTSNLHPLLKKWRYLARTQKDLHASAYHHFHYMNVFYMTSIIILSGISGFSSILVGALQGQSCPDGFYFTLGTGLLSVTAASLSGVYDMLSLAKKESTHQAFSAKFQDIVREINTEAALCQLNRKAYTDQSDFIRRMNLEFHSLCETAPTIPSHIDKRHGDGTRKIITD